MVHFHVTFLKLKYKHTIFIFPFLPLTLSMYLLTMCSFKLIVFDLFYFCLKIHTYTHTHIYKYINKICSIFMKLHTWILSQDWQLGWYLTKIGGFFSEEEDFSWFLQYFHPLFHFIIWALGIGVVFVDGSVCGWL